MVAESGGWIPDRDDDGHDHDRDDDDVDDDYGERDDSLKMSFYIIILLSKITIIIATVNAANWLTTLSIICFACCIFLSSSLS